MNKITNFLQEGSHEHESHETHETKTMGSLDLLKSAIKVDLPIDKSPEILKKLSDGPKIDLTNISPDLKKIATSELTNIVKDQVTKVETITKGSKTCKQCEGHHATVTKEIQTTNGIPNLANVGGVLNILAKPVIQEKKEENGEHSPKSHSQAKEGININPLQGFGILPPPPKIELPNILHNSTELPKIGLPFPPPVKQEISPLSLLDPVSIIKSLLIRPILEFMGGMLEKGFDKLKEIAKYFAQRPYLAMPLMVFLMSILLPVFLFILFAFMTTAISFVGFVIAEGTVLAMGGMVLTGFLVSFFSVILMFITTYGVIYMGLKSVKLIK